MNRTKVVSTGCAVLAICVLGAMFALRSKAQQNSGIYPVRAGYADMTRLASFAPDRLDNACEQLRTKHLTEAVPVFRAELRQHPQSLVAYVGFSQADPAFRASEIRRLGGGLNSQSLRPLDKFKLGLQLFYQWGSQSQEQNQAKNNALLYQATELLEQGWKQTRQPLAGCMTNEAYDMGGAKGPYFEKEAKITKAMILDLAGKSVYSMYERAGQTDWQTDPPAADLVPCANWKALGGVLGERWSFLSTSFTAPVIQEGKVVSEKTEHPTQNRGESDYIDHWRDVLAAALRSRKA